jgi:hypothetical protein
VTAVNGCVADVSSPATVLRGTARSSTENSGVPVSRSSTNSIPVLVAWRTAGTALPSLMTVVSAGGEALS